MTTLARVARGFVFLLLAGLALFGSAFAQAPATRGKTIQLSHVDAGTLPAPRLGGLVYDTLTQKILVSDAGTWAPLCP